MIFVFLIWIESAILAWTSGLVSPIKTGAPIARATHSKLWDSGIYTGFEMAAAAQPGFGSQAAPAGRAGAKALQALLNAPLK